MSAAFRLAHAAAVKRPAARKTPVFPVEVITPHPLAWAEALRLAGGDVSRLRAQPDGSVVVRNPRQP